MGDVDFVAQIISMFFMVTYGAICTVSFLEHFAADPSYRPAFRSRWYFSGFGAVISMLGVGGILGSGLAALTRRALAPLPVVVGATLLDGVLLVAFARPRSGTEYQEVTSEGIDIMLALDVSSSMQAEDFKPRNRLHVAKSVVAEFLDLIRNDRVGLVVFAGQAFTQCPLTLDYIDDWGPLFAEFHRVLRPGGRLVYSHGHPMSDYLLSSN